MFDLENAIMKWRKQLRKNSALEDGYIKELESHLRDEIAKGLDEGKVEEEAFNDALKKIGEIENLGEEFYKTDTTHFSKKPPWKELPWISNLLAHNFKIALRIFRRQKGYSFINILGLAIGMAACLLILQYVIFEKSYDKFHKNYEDIYRVLNYRYYKSGTDISAGCNSFVGPIIKEEFPEVLSYTRCRKIEPAIRYKENIFKEANSFYADSTFFSLFSFPLLKGNPKSVLAKPFTAVLTETTAKKYFGDDDPIGKTITAWSSTPYTVTGIAADVLESSHLKFDIILSFQSQYGEHFCEICNNNNTYIKLDRNANPGELEAKLPLIIEKVHAEENNAFEREYKLQPLKDIHLYSNVRFEHEINGDGGAVSILTIVAIAILLIAWLNYINLATARSLKRAKETGLRKVIGANKIHLIKQFLLESFLLNFMAVVTALVIVFFAFNSFHKLVGRNFNFAMWNDLWFWLVLIGMVFVGSFLSGIYPALIISSFSPTVIFRNKITGKGKAAGLRKGLIIFQFTIAVALIACTITVYKQVSFMRNKNLGINIKQTVAVNWASNFSEGFDYYGAMDAFIGDLQNQPSIKDITFASVYPGIENGEVSGGIRPQGTPPEDGKQIYSAWIADSFLNFFNIKLICGRNFLESDLSNLYDLENGDRGILINKSAGRVFGFANPEDAMGKNIVNDNKLLGCVVGVINDYHQLSLDKTLNPTLYYGSKWGIYYIIRINTQDVENTISLIKDIYRKYYPGNAFVYSFIDEIFDKQYKMDIQFGEVFGLFTSLAIFIACLGLLGLVSYTTLQRTKEIGIRKTLGASVNNIMVLIAKDFFKLIIVSITIAIPAAYYLIITWLGNYAFKISLGWWFFLIPVIVTLIITFLAVGYNIIKAAVANPADSLKYE